jgi:hypothetical protein
MPSLGSVPTPSLPRPPALVRPGSGAHKLGAWLAKREITPYRLAYALEVSHTLVGSWLRGVRTPSPLLRYKLQYVTEREVPATVWAKPSQIKRAQKIIADYAMRRTRKEESEVDNMSIYAHQIRPLAAAYYTLGREPPGPIARAAVAIREALERIRQRIEEDQPTPSLLEARAYDVLSEEGVDGRTKKAREAKRLREMLL